MNKNIFSKNEKFWKDVIRDGGIANAFTLSS